MLVLSRKEQERILIGDSIEIVICHISPGQVRIGIEAPLDISIVRGELEPLPADEGQS